MTRTLEITAQVTLPDLPLERVEWAAQQMVEAIMEVERGTGLEFGPVCSVNSRTHAAIVYFTCDSALLSRIGAALIDSGVSA